MDPLSLIVLTLSTWRVSTMFVQEDGPGLIFRRVRALTGIQHDKDGKVFLVPDTFLAGLISCMWCVSVWVGAGWVILWHYWPSETMFGATIFALSALAIIIDRLFHSP